MPRSKLIANRRAKVLTMHGTDAELTYRAGSSGAFSALVGVLRQESPERPIFSDEDHQGQIVVTATLRCPDGQPELEPGYQVRDRVSQTWSVEGVVAHYGGREYVLQRLSRAGDSAGGDRGGVAP